MAAPRSPSLFVYLLIAVCLILLAPYFGVHLFVTEPPEPSEIGGAIRSTNQGLSGTEEAEHQEVKPSKALSDIEDLLDR